MCLARCCDSLARAAKSFPGEITLRFPTIAAKPHCHRAGLILAKEFDAARSHILGPFVVDPFVLGKIARRGDDQSRPHGIEKWAGSGIPEMMLALDPDVAVQICVPLKQLIFRFDSTVRR